MSKRPTMIARLKLAAEHRQEQADNRQQRQLTKRQREILRFIAGHLERYGFPPTIGEIGESFGFSSPNAAFQHVRAIEKKGYLTREANFARAIRLTKPETA